MVIKIRLKSIAHGIWRVVSNKKNLIVFALFLLLLFGVQLGLFFITEQTVSYNEKELSGTDEEVLTAIVSEDVTIELVHGEKRLQQRIAPMGININEDVAAEQLQDRKPYSRLIPFVGLFIDGSSLELQPQYTIDEEKLHAASEEIAAALSYDAEDAGLAEQEGGLVATPEKEGSMLSSDVVFRTLAAYFSNPQDKQVVFAGKSVSAELTAEELKSIIETYQSLLLSSLIVQVDDREYVLGPDEILGLVEITSDSLQFSGEAATELVGQWTKDIVETSGTTKVTYVDDKETDRIIGSDGRGFNTDEMLQDIAAWIDNPTDGEVLSYESFVVPARVVEDRIYTATSAGLKSLLENWISENAGTYSVYVEELDSGGRKAAVHDDISRVMASTYKVFLSAVAYHLAENGEISLNKKVYGNSTVEDCIRLGIINSDNPCMIALGKYIGWAKVDSTIAAMGFKDTVLNNYNSDGSFNGDKTSTARDMAQILKQLSNGTLLSSANTKKLLGYMAQDIYDDGIPAGSGGSNVEHKVGFLYALKHDMGIVYAPESTYVLVVLSDNSSWSRIADVSQEIFTFLN